MSNFQDLLLNQTNSIATLVLKAKNMRGVRAEQVTAALCSCQLVACAKGKL